MLIKGKEFDLSEEQCENTKKAVSKYGISVVCDENEVKEKIDIVMSSGEDCENLKEVVSKYGVSVLCEE